MKKILSKISFVRLLVVMGLIVVSSTFNSCKDDFFETHKPSWLGESLYDQIVLGYKDDAGVNHTFNTFKRLIDDNLYAEVLKKTGSKTLFVADDAAFERFYKSNTWGVKSYEAFTVAQKKMLMNSSMINNAYLIELMSSTVGYGPDGPNKGQAMRRSTAVAVVDSVPFEPKANIPYNSNWDVHRETGYMLAKDNTPIPMVHFLQQHMDFKGITNDDFEFIFKGVTRSKNDAYIYGNKVIVKDITCKNGYMNILDNVLITPSNMAEVIRTNASTKIFSRILDRFSVPIYDDMLTKSYKSANPGFKDSIFVKRYFSKRSATGGMVNNPYNKNLPEAGLLAFDPGWNTYFPEGTTGMDMQTDMGVMFVPGDKAITDYFSPSGDGYFLIEKYKTIDGIPNDKLIEMINNHMKPSFIGALPHRFPEVLDDGQERMGIAESDVDSSMIGTNGVVYITKKLYPPAAYSAVTAPALVNDYMKIFNWAIRKEVLGFNAYLLSMDSKYSYMIPSDITANENPIMGKGMYYVDPVSLGKTQPEIFKFWFDGRTKVVNATVYKYTPLTNTVGDSILLLRGDLPTDKINGPEIIKDRLEDMLDYHIVVGDIEDGKEFYRTKGGGEIRVVGAGVGAKLQGGGNLEDTIPTKTTSRQVTKLYNQRNGNTYLLDAPLMPSTKSVYKILSEEPQFSEFFKLLLGNDQATIEEKKKYDIFYKDKTQVGLDYNIKFFNTYHYTVYVPTNAAVLDAIANGLPTWDMVKNAPDLKTRTILTEKLIGFLRYHFQDNSIYMDGTSSEPRAYETASSYSTSQWEYTYNDDGTKKDSTLATIKSYYKLYTKLTPTGLSVAANMADLSNGSAVNVLSNQGVFYPKLNNVMAREYKFDSGDLAKATKIETSSYAVIHQVDKVLLFSKDELSKMKQLTKGLTSRSKAPYKKSSAK